MEFLNLNQRINQVYRKVKSVVKDDEVSISKTSSYSAVSHDAVTKALHDAITESGVAIWPSIEEAKVSTFTTKSTYDGQTTEKNNFRADVRISVDFVNIDDPNDFKTVKGFAYALDSGDKAVGKALSMAAKNLYLKVFFLESLDEEEARPTEEGSSYEKKDKSNPMPTGNAQQQKPPNSSPQKPGCISDKQAKLLSVTASKSNWNDADLKGHLINNYKVSSRADIPWQKFNEILKFVENNPMPKEPEL